MFWRHTFALANLVLALETTVTTYSSTTCGEGTDTRSYMNEYNYPSCDDYLNNLKNICKNDFALSSSYCETMALDVCVTGGFANAQGAQGMTFVCGEITKAPTKMPTDATCDDKMMNGDEEGVDCGGSCSPCPTNCEAYECEENYSLIESPETEYCAAYPCGPSDLDTCCEMNALCSEISGGAGCGSTKVVIAEADSTYCESTECEISDRSQCCVAASSCENFALCDDTTQFLRDDPNQLFCASNVCDKSDISKCCANKAACSTWQCNFDAGYTNVHNDINVYCFKDTCTLDDSSTCCTARASCETFVCEETMYLDKEDKDSQMCSDSDCVATDWTYCCDEKGTCENTQKNFVYSCAATGRDLVDNPRRTYCTDTECSSPQDDEICCPYTESPTRPPTPGSPTLSPTTSSPTTSSPTEIAGQHRATCAGYNCGDGKVLNAEALCETDNCDAGDADTCCSAQAASGGGSQISTGIIIVIVVVVVLLVIAIVALALNRRNKAKGGARPI